MLMLPRSQSYLDVLAGRHHVPGDLPQYGMVLAETAHCVTVLAEVVKWNEGKRNIGKILFECWAGELCHDFLLPLIGSDQVDVARAVRHGAHQVFEAENAGIDRRALLDLKRADNCA